MTMNDLPANPNDELDNLADAIRNEIGFRKTLKFIKGQYFVENIEVELGTQFIAHCIGFTKCWIKFQEGEKPVKKMYRGIGRERCPERDELPDLDQTFWEEGLNGQPKDPWNLQFIVPMENPDTDEKRLFVTTSAGGRRAVGELIDQYITRVRRHPQSGQPLVRLQKTYMPTKKFGNVVMPLFEITGWTDAEAREPIREIPDKAISETEMDDEIPF
jgi:hypothetical protein